MRHRTIRKWFWAWDFDKEEKWLNDMAKKGWALDEVGFCRYGFSECAPGEYVVRLEMLENMPSSEAGQDYIDFVEGTGAEMVGSYMRWAYFRRKAADGGFDLFSDIDSRIRHLDRIMKTMGVIGLANLAIGLSNLRLSGLGMINILCAALLGYACYRLNQKKTQLKNERTLHE